MKTKTNHGAEIDLEPKVNPIRTVEDWRASERSWGAAMMVSCATDDREELQRADAACRHEERRMEEAEPYFEFDDDGFVDIKSQQDAHQYGLNIALAYSALS